MKIVINKCFGGFSLSPAGEAEYLKRKGKKAFFYTQTKYKHECGVEEYERIDKMSDSRSFNIYTVTKDLGKVIKGEAFNEDGIYFSCRDIERNDPDLVAVVEKLGDKANGSCAELSIVDIPDGVEWEISDYDGQESVEEKHRSWR
jgi:hypothetical protein